MADTTSRQADEHDGYTSTHPNRLKCEADILHRMGYTLRWIGRPGRLCEATRRHAQFCYLLYDNTAGSDRDRPRGLYGIMAPFPPDPNGHHGVYLGRKGLARLLDLAHIEAQILDGLVSILGGPHDADRDAEDAP